jgi:HNH endonuclease
MFVRYRQMLIEDESIAGHLRSLFSFIPLARRLNYERTSYSFKHLFEDILGVYVSHGACIAAAYMSGVPVKRCEKDHAGAYLGIAEEVVGLLEEHLLEHEGRGASFFTELFLTQLRKPVFERMLRGPVSKKLRFMILKRDHYRCQLCGTAASDSPDVRLHVDHILSRAYGGTNEPRNLHTLCADCNEGKGVESL